MSSVYDLASVDIRRPNIFLLRARISRARISSVLEYTVYSVLEYPVLEYPYTVGNSLGISCLPSS